MSNVLVLHGSIHLVCKFIICNVYFTNDYGFIVFNFENITKNQDKHLAKYVKCAHVAWTYTTGM